MKKNTMILSFLIVLAVIVVLVLITINKKEAVAPSPEQVGQVQQQPQPQQNNMGNTQQVEGVKITVLKEGTGDAAKAGDTVAMNYQGSLDNGTVFDSNVDPKFKHVEPFVFTLGAGQVIKGWDIGVAGMKTGEQRKLEIQSAYAYGATGAGNGLIPANANLTFMVELVAIKK
jgi:FK506-binding nuclear protein